MMTTNETEYIVIVNSYRDILFETESYERSRFMVVPWRDGYKRLYKLAEINNVDNDYNHHLIIH